MKKTLIALAALSSFAGIVQAQSSVTLYGIADAGIGSKSTTVRANTAGVVANTKTTQTVIDSGSMATSRFGMRGVEDLGGGLKAVFNLEGGIELDTGAGNTSGGNLFSRQATVGLSGDFGTVTLGRQLTAYYTLAGATNHSDNTVLFSLTQNAQVYANGVADYTLRSSNSVRYTSPSFGGFSGAAMFGTGEDKDSPVGTSASRNASLHLKYANGPLLVGYAYQNERFKAGAMNGLVSATPLAATSTSIGERDYNLFAGSYDFGVAKITGSYQAAKQKNSAVAANNGKDKEFQTGVSVPLGASTLYAGYVRSKSDATGLKAQGFTLLGTYSLSKRTSLYAGGITQKYDLAALAVGASSIEKRNAVVAGLRHNF